MRQCQWYRFRRTSVTLGETRFHPVYQLLVTTEQPRSRNLWERAAARLQDKHKPFIELNGTVNLKELISTLEAKKTRHESNRVMVSRGADRDPIVLHEVFSRAG